MKKILVGALLLSLGVSIGIGVTVATKYIVINNNEESSQDISESQHQYNLTAQQSDALLERVSFLLGPDGSGPLSRDDFDKLQLLVRSKVSKNSHKYDKDLKVLGGVTVANKIVDNLLDNKTTEDIVDEFITTFDQDFILDSTPKIASKLVYKIGQVSKEYSFDEIVAANIVLSSLDTRALRKNWLNSEKIANVITKVDRKIKAKVNLIKKENSDFLNSAMNSLLTLKKKQRTIDYYATQVKADTTAIEDLASTLNRTPTEMQGRGRIFNNYARAIITQRQSASAYLNEVKSFLNSES